MKTNCTSARLLGVLCVLAIALLSGMSCGSGEVIKSISTDYSVSGKVWHDTDGDGEFDPYWVLPPHTVDHWVEGVEVDYVEFGPQRRVWSDTTDAGGYFSITVPAGVTGALLPRLYQTDYNTYDPTNYFFQYGLSGNEVGKNFRGYSS